MSMNKPLYKKYAYTKPIGTIALSNYGGLEILDIFPKTAEAYCVTAWNFGNRYCVRKNRVYFSRTGRPYVRKGNMTFYLDVITIAR